MRTRAKEGMPRQGAYLRAASMAASRRLAWLTTKPALAASACTPPTSVSREVPRAAPCRTHPPPPPLLSISFHPCFGPSIAFHFASDRASPALGRSGFPGAGAATWESELAATPTHSLLPTQTPAALAAVKIQALVPLPQHKELGMQERGRGGSKHARPCCAIARTSCATTST